MLRRLMVLVMAGGVAACGVVDRGVAPTGPAVAASTAEDEVIGEAAGYTLELLPSLYEGHYATAFAINDNGTIVGYGEVGGGHGCRDISAAIAWNNSIAHNINADIAAWYGWGNPLPGPACVDIYSSAIDVNSAGDVVVPTSFFGDNSNWTWNASTGLSSGGFGGRLGGALALNNRGELVGYVDDGQYPRYAALWPLKGPIVDIDPREQNSIAFGISDDGDILGCVAGVVGRWRVGTKAVLSREVCGEELPIGFGLYVRNVGGITRDGIAAFSAFRNGVPTALVWRRNTISDAGWSPGAASDISERGRMVGWAYGANGRVPRAVTRLRNGAVQWLPTPTANADSRAYGVNACGDVVGYVFDAKGFQRAALWRADTCDQAGTW